MQNTKKGLEKSLMLPIDQIPQEYLEAYNHNVRANELSLNRFLKYHYLSIMTSIRTV